jgi:hypothetical protein
MSKRNAIPTMTLVIGATLAAGTAQADCSPTCLPLLCPGPTTTIVQGEVATDPAAVLGVSFIVDSVLKLAPGATAPAPGTRLQPWTIGGGSTGPAVGYYQGAALERPAGLFFIEDDGNVHCRGEITRPSAPKGMGVPPERLATLSPEECAPVLAAAGYTSPPCNDTGFGCSTAGPAPGRPGWPLVTAAMIALALTVRRARGQGDKIRTC